MSTSSAILRRFLNPFFRDFPLARYVSLFS
nr:MAG TPA: hypothetical protein [Caudoviricetes sp.]